MTHDYIIKTRSGREARRNAYNQAIVILHNRGIDRYLMMYERQYPDRFKVYVRYPELLGVA